MIEAILISVVIAATPILIAALGEVVAERSGVLNLGVEGMMIVGAVTAFATAQTTGMPYLAVLTGGLAGVAMAGLFALLAVWLATNQVATGLALTLFGLGVASLAGEAYVGRPGVKLDDIAIPGLSEIPFVGPLFFAQSPLFYLSILLTLGVAWFLFRTRAGLQLRAVGDQPAAAHALGLKVNRTRTLAVLFGGLCAGIAGAQLTLVYTPQWIDGLSAGRGWIALALVVFASWRPMRVLAGAYLFGAVTIAQFHAQALGVEVPSQFLSALPYLATILVLVIFAANRRFTMVNTPAALGRPFVPDR
ncbi:ABC transporter permease [Acuticoccus sp. I52.16.1]|uniref:ABC transporter permease n=1 Tax=Acuticoccus sp. I52.16.1 TaxID=2928472 RepID=UPI001FD49CD0|nr:ABC transporter permease [Acuticoccus sp. I52.16.1]UOM33144.1 ABC transporter permease [Acuticoccus sp. I52.16.1]